MRQRVKVQRIRSLGITTDQDLTGPVMTSLEGELVEMRVGEPLVLVLQSGRRWSSTLVQRMERSGRIVEVQTKRTVYQVRYLE